jgi:putative membrane protein
MFALNAVVAQMAGRGARNMQWGDNGRPWGMVIVMIVLAALLVGAIVWALVYASRASRRHAAAPPAPVVAGVAAPVAGPTPREILDLRYARGEIDTADYEERRSKLECSPTSPARSPTWGCAGWSSSVARSAATTSTSWCGPGRSRW